ncbi:MAG: lamin tail domain-containing protein, partial [Planctomycetota bacterium]
DDNAEIRYTTDGSQPTITHGNTYTSPILIDKTTTIRAVAVRPGWLDSEVETYTYIFLSDVITQSPTGQAPGPGWPTGSVNGQVIDYGMDPDVVDFPSIYEGLVDNALAAIPTFSIVTDLGNLFDPSIGIYVNAREDGRDWERPVSVELLNPNGSEGFQVNAGLRIRGAFSRSDNNPKHSFRLFFRTVYGPGKLRYPLFGSEGTDEFDKIDLRTSQNNSWAYQGSTQNTLIRDVFSRDVQRDMGQPYTRSRYYHLYINGHYWGLFQTQERADADFAESYLGGDKEEYDVVKNDSSGSRVLHATDGTMDAYQRLYNAAVAGFSSNSAYFAVQGLLLDGTPDPAGERLLDPENIMDYMICTYYTGDPDAPVSCWAHFSNNVFAIYNRVRPQGFTWYRHDAEHSLGANGGIYEGRLLTDPTDRSIGQDWGHFNPAWLHLRLTANPEYLIKFTDRVHNYFWNSGLLTETPNTERWNTRADQIDMAIIAESARWGDAKTHPPRTKADWEGQNDYMVNTYFPGRTQIVVNQMRSVSMFPNLDAPIFNINGSYKHGGRVSVGDQLTMINPDASGTIYYTTDGSDPRQPVTGNAVGIPYSPVTLTKSTLVKARVLDGVNWSALNEAAFAIGPVVENLRVTEIMYHPRNTGNINDPNEEFIELKNIGTSTLNLNLVKFTEGIHFTFPDMELDPDEFVVVVKNQSAFEAQYGTSVNTAGQYTGSLDNNGERIKLVDAAGEEILDFEYKDGWRQITDGDGFSLTVIDPTDSAVYGSIRGLVAHWMFDEGSGSTATDSAGTNNGALIGGPTWTDGRINGALSFDGVDDYVVVAPIAPLMGNNVTAQAWIRTSEFAGIWNPVITQNAGNGYYFYISSGRPAFYIVVGAAFVQAISQDAINPDEWYHVAGTNDGSNLKLYIDGQLEDSDNSTGFLGVSSNAYIGCEPTSSLYYNGLIDDVRIYDRAVSETELQDITNPMRRWSNKDSWRASVYRNGTPGWDDSGILPDPGAIVINEVLAHSNAGPDWIELHNTTNDPINIGGWYLSDNDRDEPNLTKYRIADGTTIAGNDYVVFYQDKDFNNPGDPGCLIPFALSENGEEACISSYLDPNGFLTGYRQVEDFGASQTNVSLGRYYKSSTGNFNFVAMDYNTPDSNNAYPKVGPVVINEIMYNPPTGNQNEEYIELHNVTGTLVTLYRHDKSASWKFTDGIDYTFSASPVVTIQAYGYLVLTKDLTAFTAAYGSMPPGVQVLEGYSGRLSNAGERLQIAMPGDIDELGNRHYIRIDRVTYSDGRHPEDCPGGVDLWPTEADGLGKSLSRKVGSDYGNDVANWQAATPSPGTANP